jgi:hypothetical protein
MRFASKTKFDSLSLMDNEITAEYSLSIIHYIIEVPRGTACIFFHFSLEKIASAIIAHESDLYLNILPGLTWIYNSYSPPFMKRKTLRSLVLFSDQRYRSSFPRNACKMCPERLCKINFRITKPRFFPDLHTRTMLYIFMLFFCISSHSLEELYASLWARTGVK